MLFSGMKTKKKRGAIEDYLIWILLALFALAIGMILIFVLKGTGTSIVEKIKGIFRGG